MVPQVRRFTAPVLPRACSWLFICLTAAVGCGSPGGAPPSPPGRVISPGALVDSDGGTVTREVAGWQVSVTLPEGAVSSPVDLRVEPLAPESGVIFSANFSPSPYQFQRPIEVRFNECAVAGLPYVLPVAARAATKVNGVWEPLPTERRGLCELVATVNHFSVIGLLPEGEHAETYEQTGNLFVAGAVTFDSTVALRLLHMTASPAAIRILFESEDTGPELMSLNPTARLS